MKRLLLSILAFSSLLSGFAWAEDLKDCSDQVGSCEYYQCRESVQHCGKDGYFLRFGYHYCNRFFKEVSPKVSDAEKAWLERVGACLQKSVQGMPLYLSCNQIEDEAIADHTECYVQTGFCAMPISMRFRLFSVVYGELKDERMFATFMKIIDRCDIPHRKKYSVEEDEEFISWSYSL